MRISSTLFLKTVIILLGLAVFVFCAFLLPLAIRAELRGDFDYAPLLIGMYLPAIPFFIALHQALKILRSIDTNTTFSSHSVQALRKIKYCALTISALYAIGMPYIFHVAQQDDAPGLVAIGLVLVGAAFVVAIATAVLEKLLHNAIEIKTENDMTV